MLQERFKPKLDEMGIREVCFHQDGAQAHYGLIERDYLCYIFPDKWIGRGLSTSPTSTKWPQEVQT